MNKNSAVVLSSLFAVSSVCGAPAKQYDFLKVFGPAPKENGKIISLAPGVTETLFALGINEKQIIGVSKFCNYPPQTAGIAKFGDAFSTDIEKIFSAKYKPDIIFTAQDGTELARRVTSKNKNISVVEIKPCKTIEDVYSVVSEIGVLLEKNKTARTLVSKMKKTANRSNPQDKSAKKPKIYFEISNDGYGPYSAGKSTFISSIIEKAGGVNALNDDGFVKTDCEKLSINPPDIVIKTHRGGPACGLAKKAKVFGCVSACADTISREGPRAVEGIKIVREFITAARK